MTIKYKIIGFSGCKELEVTLTHQLKNNPPDPIRFSDDLTTQHFPTYFKELLFTKEEAQTIINFNSGEEAPLTEVLHYDRRQWRKEILMGIGNLQMVAVSE